MIRNAHRGIVALLAATAFLVTAEAGPAFALTYPTANSGFLPECADASAEFCVEKFEFTPAGGTARSIANPTTSRSGAGQDPYLEVNVSTGYRGLSTPNQVGGFMPVMSLRYHDPVGKTLPDPTVRGTVDGLADGLYRAVIRTGDYDPSYMLLAGRFESYSVTKGADGYFTIDLSARPAPRVAVEVIRNEDGSQDRTMVDSCFATRWIGTCEGNQASKLNLTANFVMVSEPADQEVLRGTWMSSNGSFFSVDRSDLATGEIRTSLRGPHLVPADFPTAGLTQEGSRYLNPASFEMDFSYATIAKILSRLSGATVTDAQAKALLANPADVIEATIETVASAGATPRRVAQEIRVTRGATSARISFNLTTFSAPNPNIKFKKVSTAGLPSDTSTPSSGAEVTRKSKRLRNNVTLRIVDPAERGKSYSAKDLLSPTAGATLKRVKSTTPSVCTTRKSQVTMLVAGTCKLVVTVVYNRRPVTVNLPIRVV